MAKKGGFFKEDMSNKDKLLYRDFMQGKIDEFEYKGKHFSAAPMFPKKKKKT